MDNWKESGSLKRLLNSSGGFSLIEVMIGGAILVGVGVAGSMLFQNQNKMQARVNHEAILDRFHNSVAKILSSVHHCNATFNHAYDAATIGTADNISQIRLCESNCTFDASAQEVVPGSVYAAEGKSIDVNDRQIWELTRIAYAGTPITNTGTLQLRFTYNLHPKLGTRTVVKDAMVNMRFSGGQFKECISGQESIINNLQKVICDSLATNPIPAHSIAAWNEAEQKCDLKTINLNCETAGNGVGGINVNGVATCNPIKNSPDPVSIPVDCEGKRLSIVPILSGGVMKLTTQCN